MPYIRFFLLKGLLLFLWKDRSRAAEAAAVMKMSAAEACELGLIEAVLPEGDVGEAAHETRKLRHAYAGIRCSLFA